MELKCGEVLDDLLIDNLKIIQNVDYYRFTSDSVLLSKFASAKKGDIVADFCSGSGIVGLHYYGLHKDTAEKVDLFELQAELADMSRRTVAMNGLQDEFTVHEGRIQDIPTAYYGRYSLILCNPPYESGGFENKDEKKALCRKELSLSLAELTEKAAKCLKFGGRFALCHRADRAAEVICTLHEYNIEPKRIQFVSGKEGAEPYLLLVEGTLGGKKGVKILPTIVNQ